MEREKKYNKRIKILVRNGIKTTIWSIGIIVFSILIFGVLFYKSSKEEKKGVYDVNAGAVCGQGTYQYNGCTACDRPVGSACGGSLTYECGTICLLPSCGPSACSGSSSYTVTYTRNIAAAGSLSPTSRTVTYGSSAAGPTVSTNTGYNFDNFTITSGACAGTFNSTTGACSNVRQNITIQANWSIIVTYDRNIAAGGTLSPTSRTVAYGSSATGPTVNTNTGYVFINFTITSGACAGTFTASTGTCSNVQQPITIMGNWGYVVTVNGNGGICSPGTHNVDPGSASSAQSCSRSGYIVSNFTQSGCGGTFDSSTGVCSSVTQAMTITANWTAATFSEPFNLITTYGDGKVSLGWQAPLQGGGSVTDYIIQYSGNNGSTWSTFSDGTSPKRFTTVTGLTNGTQYTFRVAAVNPAGTSSYSSTAQSTPRAINITSISPTSGLLLGGGSMTINATGLGDTQKFNQMSLGDSHSCGLSIDGKGYCWGNNHKGQLGNGSTTGSTTPVLISQGERPSNVSFTSMGGNANTVCGLGSNGQGYCWGYNNYGQLGNDNTGTDSSVPVLVKQGERPSSVTYTSISASVELACGLGSNGQAYCWGRNNAGQLGNGTGNDSDTPVQVAQGQRPANLTFTSIAVGGAHACGLGSNGQAYCWGWNGYGQLGDDSTNTRVTPVEVVQGARPAGVTFVSISAGIHHTCGVGSDGLAYCWGYNSHGQLGNNNSGSGADSDVPVLVYQGERPSNVSYISIAANYYHTCGLGSNGNGYCWGRNGSGQVGDETTTTPRTTPVLVKQGGRPTGVSFSNISVGLYHTCGIGSDGRGYCWGANQNGRLGDGTTESPRLTSVLVKFFTEYIYQITIGNNTLTQSVLPEATGITVSPIPAHIAGTVSVNLKRVYDNKTSNSANYTYNNLSGPDITSITPSTVSPNTSNTFNLTGTNFLNYGPMSNFSSISGGQSHTCGVDSDGKGYCWGYNHVGQLGNGNTGTDSNVPVLVSQGERPSNVTFTSISSQINTVCGLGSNGQGYCWGWNGYGQLGNDNTGTDSNIPVEVKQGERPTNVTFTSISASYEVTCGLGSNGQGYCWGRNNAGQLGNGTGANSDTPVEVAQGQRPANLTFTSITVGGAHACGLGSNGKAYCWGWNGYGQLGDDSINTRVTPVEVVQGARPGGVTFVSINAGVHHTCGIGSDGKGYCWGYNSHGQLGNGTSGSEADSDIPVLVSQGARPTNGTFNSITANYYHTCGVGNDGNGYCWGGNDSGQLGDGSRTDSSVPVLVSRGAIPTGVSFSSMSAGGYHTCGVGSNGQGYCWGGGGSGRLGNNSTFTRLTPSYILTIKPPTIEFRTTPATSTTYTSTTAMSAVSPTLGVGTIPVKLTNPDGQYDIYNIFAGSIPSAPRNLVATYGDGQVTLGWNKPSDEGGGVTDYIVQYSNDGGSTWSTFNDGVSPNRYATVTGLTNGNLYTFRVAAVNPTGTSPYSNTVQSTPQALSITSISPTSGSILGGGSMTINATGLGDSQKFVQISSGNSHTCGISYDGQGYCWGGNDTGQLGNSSSGSGTNSNIPVLVSQGARDPGVTFISISVGHSHTCAVGSDGEGYCWGSGSNGRLGNGGTSQSPTPVLVSRGARNPGVTFISISAGSSHTCAIGSDGEGYCWGNGLNGRLGNGGTSQSTTPVLVSQGARDPGVTFSSISAGVSHTCAIGSDGEGYCWGSGSNGQLGNGGTSQSPTPVLVSRGARDPGVTFISISAGSSHTCAIGSDGEGYCWGYNYYGQLGNGYNGSGTDSNIPVLVSQGARDPGVTFSSMRVGSYHTCAIGSNGEGYCWGRNYYGQLGDGSTGNSNIPVLVGQGIRNPGVTISSISAGYSHTCAIGSDGQGFCWGYNYYGQLGNGSTTSSTTPVLVAAYEYQITIGSNTLTQVIPISAGSTSITVVQIPAHAVGVVSVSLTRIVDNTTSNSVSYTYTNLPSPDITSITPSTVSPNTSNTFSLTGTNFLDYGPISNLTSVSAGGSHTCAIGSDGNGYCWGSNYYGELGNGYNGSGTDSNIPVLVSKGAMGSSITFDSISAGDIHTCGLGSDGEGYCWGYNYYGQLGNGYNGSGTDSNIPVLVSQGARDPGVTFSSISAGYTHTCGLGSDGEGYCWGYNYYGQLGNGNTGTDSNIPVLVSQGARPSGVTFSSISAGIWHTCGIGSDGNGYCWGSNNYGQLGNGGSGTDADTPVLVSQGARDPGVTFISISVSESHTCGVGSDGEGYCWGSNYYGELGNGNTGTNSNIPVLVNKGAMGSNVTFSSISVGNYSYTCGVGSDGNGYCWGYNNHGQLGNGSSGSGADSNIPVLVSQGAVPVGVTFTSISAGVWHTCGRLSNNRTLCWGNNQYGQLGNRETVDRSTPSYVLIVKSPTIEFGSTPATSTTYTSTTAMSAVSPVLSVGTIAVKLTNPDGQYDTYDISVQGPPTVPLNLGATAGNTQVVLTWNVPSSDGGSSITDYIIQYSTDNSTWTTFNDGTSTNTTATVTGLTNNTQYYFRVAAVNSIGTGPYTSSVTATPVNVAPTFTNISNTSPVTPGNNITWSTTASDSDGQVKLLVCKTPGITNGTCNGDSWCSSSLVSSNPSCSYSVPNPMVNDTYDAYVYIVDNQNEPATGVVQGTNSSFIVSSIAPTVTNVTLNGGNAITLVESDTKSVTLTATVTSSNTCSSITSVKGYLYRSGIGYTGCDTSAEANNNYCYPEVSCTLNSGSCVEGTEGSANYTCTINVQYFADPTDIGTQYDSQNWLATIKATNSGDLSTSTEVTTGVEMNSLTAFSVTSTLSYSDLLVGESNNPLDRVLTTTATGNVGLDQEHKGEGIGMCTDYPTCEVGTPIALSHQKYSLTASTPYSTPTTAISLTNTSVEVELNLAKPTSTTAVSKNTWWGVFIPPGTLPGYYQGRNTITAVKGETTHW